MHTRTPDLAILTGPRRAGRHRPLRRPIESGAAPNSTRIGPASPAKLRVRARAVRRIRRTMISTMIRAPWCSWRDGARRHGARWGAARPGPARRHRVVDRQPVGGGTRTEPVRRRRSGAGPGGRARMPSVPGCCASTPPYSPISAECSASGLEDAGRIEMAGRRTRGCASRSTRSSVSSPPPNPFSATSWHRWRDPRRTRPGRLPSVTTVPRSRVPTWSRPATPSSRRWSNVIRSGPAGARCWSTSTTCPRWAPRRSDCWTRWCAHAIPSWTRIVRGMAGSCGRLAGSGARRPHPARCAGRRWRSPHSDAPPIRCRPGAGGPGHESAAHRRPHRRLAAGIHRPAMGFAPVPAYRDGSGRDGRVGRRTAASRRQGRQHGRCGRAPWACWPRPVGSVPNWPSRTSPAPPVPLPASG